MKSSLSSSLGKIKPQHCTWEDDYYSDFMITFLNFLEPRLFPPNFQIYTEEQEVEEAYFITQGSIKVGFLAN